MPSSNKNRNDAGKPRISKKQYDEHRAALVNQIDTVRQVLNDLNDHWLKRDPKSSAFNRVHSVYWAIVSGLIKDYQLHFNMVRMYEDDLDRNKPDFGWNFNS